MISFCIITDNKEPDKFNKEIDSIKKLNIADYEIIVTGAIDICDSVDIVIPNHIYANNGNLGAMRNACCRKAKGNILIVVDDDIVFHKNFYDGLMKYGNDFDVLSCQFLNSDGTRFWDWKTFKDNYNELLDYDKTHEDISLTGGLTIMKSYVFEKVQWDESLGFYQFEDVDFSNKLKAANFRINFNIHSIAYHNDLRYTQSGKHVWKKW